MALYTSHIWSFTVPNSLRIKYLDSITLTVISIPNVDLLILAKSGTSRPLVNLFLLFLRNSKSNWHKN